MVVRRVLAAVLVAGVAGMVVPAHAAPIETRAAVIAAARAAQVDPAAATAPGAAVADATPPQPNPSGSAGDVRLVVNEGFEQVDRILGGRSFAPGSIYANGWIRRNNSDHPWFVWQQGRTDYFLASDGVGDDYIASHPFSTLADAGTLSSWLLSPPINFAPGTRLTFRTRSLEDAWPTRLQVRACVAADCSDVGTLPEDVGNFGVILQDINPGEVAGAYPLEWTQYTLTAADGLPTSGTGRIAFRHHVHQDDGELRGGWIGIDRVVVEQGEDEVSALDLTVTVAPASPGAPDACGSETTLDAATGDQVNLCYRVQNNTAQTLRYHSLRDDHSGALLTEQAIALAPGASYQYNRLLTVSESIAPSATWSAQADPAGYARDDTQPAQWIEINDGQPVTGTLAFPPDFDFRLFGDRIDTLCVGSGLIANRRDFYGSCPSTGSFGLLPMPDPQLGIVSNAIALYQTGLIGGGGVFQKIVGTAPNRRYIIEYYKTPVDGGSTDPERGLSAQVILHEGTDVIEFQYGNRVFGGNPGCAYGGCASIGLQDKNLAQQYSFRTQSLRNVDRIVWTPADHNVFTRTRQVQITVRTPVLDVVADAIDIHVEAGGTASAQVSIGNDGDGRLDWAAGAAQARSHMPAQARVLPPRVATPIEFGAYGTAAGIPLSGITSALQLAPIPAGASTPDPSLWAFDLMWGYLLRADPAMPSYSSGYTSIQGNIGTRLITGADFLDDDFTRLYAFDAGSNTLLRYAPIGAGGNISAVEQRIGTARLPIGVTAGGLKQDPTSGALYLTTANGVTSQLWTIDPVTASVRLVGEITNAPGILGIDFDNEGRLFGLDIVLDALVAIDKTTGEGAIIGSLGIVIQGSISALAFDPRDDSTLYLSTFNQLAATGREDGSLWSVDTLTGQARLVSPIIGPDNTQSQFGAMAFAQAGNRCVALDAVPWLTLAQTQGSIAPGTDAVPLALGFDAAGLAPGLHTADLCIHSNDPLRRRSALPIRFTVAAPPSTAVFADGFEADAP